MAASSSASSRKQGTIRIYIDNSNIWILGQKTYAEVHGFDDGYDPTWRFDVGRLQRILAERSNLRGNAKDFEVKVYLYGPTPPPVDTIWKALKSHGVDVNTFARGTWTGREKQVDMAMGVQSAKQALRDNMSGHEREFILVSGDRDLLSAVSEIIDEGRPVYVWSWNNCLAKEYREQEDKRVKVCLLDKHLEAIGFRETTFRVDRNTINPSTIVVLDPMPKADEINAFVSGLKVPVHRYENPTQREGSSSKDLVIIPSFAHRMTHNELANLYKDSEARLKASGLSVMKH